MIKGQMTVYDYLNEGGKTLNLIGISGFKRSGKGTTGEIVRSIYSSRGKTVKLIGFADKIKIMAARALGQVNLSEEECIELMNQFKESWVIDAGPNYSRSVPEHIPSIHITGRQYLQNFGNEARKLFGETFWIDMVLPNPDWEGGRESLINSYPGVDYLCITDLRYPNEAERIKALGGVVWEVVRPGLTSDGHASEQPLPRHLVDYMIDNSGDLRALKREVELALDALEVLS